MRKNLIVLEDLVPGFGPVVQERVGKMRSCTAIGIIPGVDNVDAIDGEFDAYMVVNAGEDPIASPSGLYVRSPINPGLTYPNVVQVGDDYFVSSVAMIINISNIMNTQTNMVVFHPGSLEHDAAPNTVFYLPANTVGKLVLTLATLGDKETCSVINNAEGSFFNSAGVDVVGMKQGEEFEGPELDIPIGVSVVHRQGDTVFISSM